MGPLGRLVIIRRTGTDGTHFPLCRNTCLFGRGLDCDIRIQLPVVSQQHCRIDMRQQEALLINLSTANPTQLNGAPVNEPVKLKHGDLITIIDRSFRFESGSFPEGSNSAGHPGQRPTEAPVRQAEDGADSNTLPSEKRASTPTDARPPSQPTDASPHPRKSPPRVLSQIKRKTPNASPKTPKTRLGNPEVPSSHTSSADEVENKNEEMSLKRRRVSFGGSLRPELFDENLPPNTPLKRGETPGKRQSLGVPAPAVLKKIRRESSLAPENGESSSNILSEAKSSSASDSNRPSRPGTPRRRSARAPSRRKSVDRNTLQIIFPKRRSSISKAKLHGGRSWADVVKLGTKKQQMKPVKQDSQKHTSRKQRRKSTPQKLLDYTENPFSTGHANSPCTVIIGRAHVDKVTVPARPYRMLNNVILNRKITFTEDLSGLAEMFKTPGKEKPQRTSMCPGSIKQSETVLAEDKLGKKTETPDVTDKLLHLRKAVEIEAASQNPSEQKLESGETLGALKTWLKAPTVNLELKEEERGEPDPTPTPELPQRSRGGDVSRKTQKTTKYTPESRAVPRTSPRLWRSPCASPELVEHATGAHNHVPTLRESSPRESGSNEEGHTQTQGTPKRTPESGEMSRNSQSLLRNPSASPEFMKDLTGKVDPMPKLESPEESRRNEVHTEIQKTPLHTPKSEEASRKSQRLLKNPSASAELVKDLVIMKGQMPAPESPRESSGDDHRKIPTTPKHPPKSGERQRVSLRLLRNPNVCSEFVKDLAGIRDGTATPKSLRVSISNEEAHKEGPKTPKQTPNLRETSRSSPRLPRNPCATRELAGDLASLKGQTGTLKSPGESTSDEDQRKIRKTPRYTLKSAQTPRKPLRLLRDPPASPALVEDLARMIPPAPALRSPVESVTGEDVHREIQKMPERTPKSGDIPRMSPSLLRNPSVSSELAEDLAGRESQTPTLKPLGEPTSNEEIHGDVGKTLKQTPKSGKKSRKSLRLQSNPSGGPQLVKDLVSVANQILALGESASDGGQRQTQKTPERMPKSRGASRKSPRLLRDPPASPELMADLTRVIPLAPALESPAEAVNGEDVHREILKTPGCTPKSDEVSRKSLSPLRNLSASPKLSEDLVGIKDHMLTPKSPEQSISNKEVHGEIQKTLKWTPKSAKTPRMSLSLLRNPRARQELTEDLTSMQGETPILGSPGEAVRDDAHTESQKPPERVPKSGETPRRSSRLWRDPNVSPDVVEDLVSTKHHTPMSSPLGKSVSNEEVHREIQETPRHPPESGETPRMSLRLQRTPSASQELTEDVASVKDGTRTLQLPGDTGSREQVHGEVQEAPTWTPASGETHRISLSLLRNLSASQELVGDPANAKDHLPPLTSPKASVSGDSRRKGQKPPKHIPESIGTPGTSLDLWRNVSISSELGEDLACMKGPTQTLELPGQSGSGDGHRKLQKTPRGTPRSAQMPRVSSTLLRDPQASPEATEELSGMNDHTPTLKPPRESVSKEEIHREIQKTPKPPPKSGEAPGTSLCLLRSPRASPACVEDLASREGPAPTLGSPGELTSSNDHRNIQRTPDRTPRSGERSRTSPRLCKDPNTIPEPLEDLASVKDETPSPREPDESVKQKPESLVSPTGGSLLRPPLRKLAPVDDARTANHLKTPPQTVPPAQQQAVNTGFRAVPREEPEPLTGVRKWLRNSTEKTTPREEPTDVKTPVRTPKHSYEWIGNLSGVKSLLETPRAQPEDSTDTKCPAESDSGVLTIPEEGQDSQSPGRPVPSERPAENLELTEADPFAREDTSDLAPKNKDGPGDSEENSSGDPGEDKSQTNTSEKLRPRNVEDSGINRRTRYPRRNKRIQEVQESIAWPHQTEQVAPASHEKATEPNTAASLHQGPSLPSRHRCETDPEVHASQELPAAETVHVNKGEKKTLKSSQKNNSADGPVSEKAVSLRSRGRSKTGTDLPEAGSPAGSAEAAHTEHGDRTVESSQGKIEPMGEEKIVLRSRKKTNTDSGLVTCSDKVFTGKTEESGISPSTASRVSMSKCQEETASHAWDRVCTEKAARRGLRFGHGPGTGSEPSLSPLNITETADSEDTGRTRGRKQEKHRERTLTQEASVKTRQQRRRSREQTQPSGPLPAVSEDATTDKETRVKTRQQKTRPREETQHSPSVPAVGEDATTDKETHVKTRHQKTRPREETQHSPSVPAVGEDATTDKETRVKTRHQKTSPREETQHSPSVPAVGEDATTDKETRVKTRHWKTRPREETQHSSSVPAVSEDATAEKEMPLQQETRVKTRQQGTHPKEETQHAFSVSALCAAASTEKQMPLKHKTRVRTRHHSPRPDEEAQRCCSFPDVSEDATTEKETPVKQETRLRRRRQRTHPGEERQHSHSLPPAQEEATTGKDKKDERLLSHRAPPQGGRGLRSKSRNKVSTDAEGLLSTARPAETTHREEAARRAVKRSRQQEEAAAPERIPSLRSGKQSKVPVTTTKKGDNAEPSTESTSEKSANASSGKVAEDPATAPGPGIRSTRLRARNQTKSEAELCSKQKSTKEPSHNQSGIKSLQRATRASKRGLPEETATTNPQQDKNIIPTKRIRTRRDPGNGDAW